MSDLLGWISKGVSDLLYGSEENPNAPKLQRSGMLTREQLLEMFNTFISEIQKPETKARVKAVVGKRPVEDETTQIQREIFINMGVDGDHGLNCLQSVQSTYRADQEVIFKFMQMTEMESLACDEAELPEEEFAKRKEAFERGLQMRQTMMAVGAQMQAMMANNPQAAALLQQRAKEHMERQVANSSNGEAPNEEQVFMTAAQKLAIAREQMAKMGMNEQAVMQAAFQQLLSPSFQAPPSVVLPTDSHPHMCGGHHDHEHHGHSHSHAHSHGAEACEEDHGHSHAHQHGHSHGGVACTGHHDRPAPSTADKKDM